MKLARDIIWQKANEVQRLDSNRENEASAHLEERYLKTQELVRGWNET